MIKLFWRSAGILLACPEIKPTSVKPTSVIYFCSVNEEEITGKR
jgi:hypothetical protein